MYPTSIILLVATQRNLLERSMTAASSSSHIHRGLYAPYSSRDREDGTRNRRSIGRRIYSDISSQESITPLNVSFGPSFDLSIDLEDASWVTENMGVHEQELAAKSGSSSCRTLTADTHKESRSIVIIEDVEIGHALS